MRARLIASAALVATAFAAPTSASAATCPGGEVGGVGGGVCTNMTVTPTANTGYTVQGNNWVYCSPPGGGSFCPVVSAFMASVYVDPTGADVNGSTPPIPMFDPTTGQLSAPAGTYATVYVDGTAYSVDTPDYCFTISVRCP